MMERIYNMLRWHELDQLLHRKSPFWLELIYLDAPYYGIVWMIWCITRLNFRLVQLLSFSVSIGSHTTF